MMARLTFLSCFIISLAVMGASFFAWEKGVPQDIWANEVARWFCVAIAVVTLSAMVWLAWQAWRADEHPINLGLDRSGKPVLAGHYADASYGHVAAILCPSIGMLGTVTGLKLSLSTVGDPTHMIASAHTAFDSTGCGIVGMIVIMLMTHALEVGIKRTTP